MAPYWGLRGKPLGRALWVFCMIAIISYGYNNGVTGTVLTEDSFNLQFPRMDTVNTSGRQEHENSVIQGTVIALYNVTGAFGAVACIFLGDIYGRRKLIFASSGLMIIGAVLMASSFSLAQFIVARIVVGLGTGGLVATISVWESELSHAESRGAHVASLGIWVVIGLAIGQWLDFGLSYVSSSFSWRFPLGFNAVFSAIVMAFIFTLPESPRWLVKMGRHSEARFILSAIHDIDETDKKVDDELRDIQVALDMSRSFAVASLFRMGPQRVLHRVTIAATVQMMLQMSGINMVAYYQAVIYQENLKMSPKISALLPALSQFAAILGSAICSYTVDRYGRRKLMLFSSGSMAICLTCLTGLVSNENNSAALKAAIFIVFLYIFVYMTGFLGIPFLYASEVAPIQMRAAVSGIATGVTWILNFLVVEVTPVAINDISQYYFLIYAFFNLAFLPIIYFFFPETNNRSLEEIEEIFAKSKSIFDTVRISKTLPRRRLYEHENEGEAEIETKEEDHGNVELVEKV